MHKMHAYKMIFPRLKIHKLPKITTHAKWQPANCQQTYTCKTTNYQLSTHLQMQSITCQILIAPPRYPLNIPLKQKIECAFMYNSTYDNII